ncbi:MAG: RNA 2',3'-cyclic phosphodiesterase [Fimbriimonadaceae bacterium]|nr:RNA 2',3'-cyclic phosphodiesterase [Fimbriimonadaceae bacterium]MCC6351659.1 RNA 2',3'-cyclic phosphodiesterase [Fimbriimonadaceae bacterium]MCL4285375.1 RNA 2',3'-cyclic phosphodiesterase [Fimbriimonadaceae bacterium]QOJ11913.1 MAG: RNA 2',3'-cyclic phosphodiesterase [Chthonomonadaceae bacterium]
MSPVPSKDRVLRLFVGAWPPSEVVAKLSEVRFFVPDPSRALRWTEPEKLHLTLCFMGAQEEGRASLVESALRESAREFPPIRARVAQIGGFPSALRARVVWAGVEAEGDAIRLLAQSLRIRLQERGITFDPKPISPHVTLARVSQNGRSLGLRLPEGSKTDFGSWTLGVIRLTQSLQGREGSEYKSLSEFPLTGAES